MRERASELEKNQLNGCSSLVRKARAKTRSHETDLESRSHTWKILFSVCPISGMITNLHLCGPSNELACYMEVQISHLHTHICKTTEDINNNSYRSTSFMFHLYTGEDYAR